MVISRPVVVGFDNSPDARRAVRWASDLSRVEELPLTVVVARGDLYSLSSWADEWTRGLAEEWAGHARTLLGERGVETADVVVEDGLPSDVLVRRSHEASYLVLGARGHSAIGGALQGSVSQHVSRQAQCPVVVVRATEDETARRVVVGVDGSDSSLEALERALHYAGMRELQVSVLHAPERWNGFTGAAPDMVVPELVQLLEERDRQLLRAIEDVVARHPGVDVEVHEVASAPASALAEASRHAALVVVGSRGRGAFAGLVLGSVSGEVLRRARCPVAVIR